MWIRQIEVNAGGKTISNQDLEIEFDIPFSDKKEPDVSEIDIYNLSDETISSIKNEGYIYVNAGYQDQNNMGNILTGQVEEVLPKWQGVDKLTKIIVSDGAKKWRNATLNKTYKEGTKASLIMRDLANILSYQIVTIEPVQDITYKRGKTISGRASESLSQLVKDTKSKMFINKNRIVIRGENIGYNTGFILNSDTGLIGSPEREVEETEEKGKKKTKVKYKVVSLLNPLLETDVIVKVESRLITGSFRIVEGKHTREFNTELTLVEV